MNHKENIFTYACFLIASFILPAFLVASYTLNHFYVSGGYLWDSGWFAYLSSNSTNWLIKNPPALLGGSYLYTHISPIFILYTYIFKLLEFLGFVEYSAVWFSITQGFWFGILSVSMFLLLDRAELEGGLKKLLFILFIAILAAFNGANLASIGFPHFELAIPAALVTFFALYVNGYIKASYLFLILGLMAREDAGLHYFGLFFLLALYFYLLVGKNDEGSKRQGYIFGATAAICLIYSVGAIAFQKVFFSAGDDALKRIYLGDPIYQHLSYPFIKDRLSFVFSNRLYIFVPLLITLVCAVYRRSCLLLLGVISVLPWIIFSLLGVSFQAGTLTSYYVFPVVIGIIWPVVANALYVVKIKDLESERDNRVSLLAMFVVVFSSLIFFPFSDSNHDKRPWLNFPPYWAGEVVKVEEALTDFFDLHKNSMFAVDDAVASIANDLTKAPQWRYQLSFNRQEINNIDGVLFLQGGGLEHKAREIANEYHFDNVCLLKTTSFVYLSKHEC